MNPNVVYATNTVKDSTMRKYNFVNGKTDFKRYKVPVYGKCKIFSKNVSTMLSNPLMNCGTNFLNTLYMF